LLTRPDKYFVLPPEMPLDLKALMQDRRRIPARLLGPEEKACSRRISLCG
jgi:hypothetical protein